jgi:uncharacterized protein
MCSIKAVIFEKRSRFRELQSLLVSPGQAWPAVFVFFLVLSIAACKPRSQTPVEPTSALQSTSEEAVHFASGAVTLAGTLVIPGGPGRHPAVVLFHGSGPQARDIFTARWFASQGIAALAYDKRGVGESTGDFRSVPFMELCDDGLAAIDHLKSRKEIDPKRIGVWGLSQGGWLGPLAASRSADVAFVIAVSGPGVSPGEQMIVYYANELRAQGVPESDVQEASTIRRDIWSYMSTGNGYEKAKTELQQAHTKEWFSKAKAQQDDSFSSLPTPSELSTQPAHSMQWFRLEAVYDPVPALQSLRVPALFLFGDQDQLIPVKKSVAIIREVLAQNAHQDFTIREFPNDDHQMRLETGEAYGEADPEYFKTMKEWLRTKVQKTF